MSSHKTSSPIAESGDFEGATKRFIGRITTDRLPGTDRTYLSAFGELEQRIRNEAEAQLDEEGKRRFRELNVDVLEVQTGYDPIGDYIRARLESRQ